MTLYFGHSEAVRSVFLLTKSHDYVYLYGLRHIDDVRMVMLWNCLLPIVGRQTPSISQPAGTEASFNRHIDLDLEQRSVSFFSSSPTSAPL